MEKQKSKKQKQLIEIAEAEKSRNNSPNDKHNKEKKQKQLKIKADKINKSTPGGSEENTIYEQTETANRKPEIDIIKPEKKNVQTPSRAKRRRIRKNKTLNIAAININGIKGKIKSLESLLASEKIDIALITETKLKGADNINIKGYKCTTKNRKSDGGGVCILVSNRIANSTKEDNECDVKEHLEIKWINLESRPRNIAIGVFYGPQINDKAEKIKDIYHELETQIKQKTKENEIILGGDFNARLEIKNEAGNQTENSNGKNYRES